MITDFHWKSSSMYFHICSGDSTSDHSENTLLTNKGEENPDSLHIHKSYKNNSKKWPYNLKHVDNIHDCRPFSSIKERNHFEVPNDSHTEKQPELRQKLSERFWCFAQIIPEVKAHLVKQFISQATTMFTRIDPSGNHCFNYFPFLTQPTSVVWKRWRRCRRTWRC